MAAVEDELESVIGVARRLPQAVAEVVEPSGVDPRIVLLHSLEAHLYRRRTEELGERCCASLDPWPRPGGIHVSVDGGADTPEDARKDEPLASHIVAVDPERLRQSQPGLDPPAAAIVAVMVEDALDPLASNLSIRAVGEDGRILERNRDLVVVTIRHPALELLA